MKKSFIPAFIIAMACIGCSTENSATATEVIVYKAAGCACCDEWVTHLQNDGFKVKTEMHNDMDRIKAAHGISDKLASCHTALIGSYVIEGHVPAADIKRLLKEMPADIAGLTAPGMPMHSPGMQPEGIAPKGYNVIAFKKDGSTEVFSRY